MTFARKTLLAALSGMALMSGAGQAFALDEIRYGLLRLASQAPFFVGIERGYFAEEGIELELTYFDAAVPVAIAIASNDIDIGGVGLTSAFFNLAAEGNMKLFMGHGREVPGMHNTGVFVSNAAWDGGLDTWEEVQGRSIALTALGATNHVGMAMIAEKYGLDLSQSHLIPAQSLGNMGAMLQGNQVDVAAGAATGIMPLVESGEAKLLGWVGDEVTFQLSAFAGNAEWIDENRDLVERFTRAVQRGMDDYQMYLMDRTEDGGFTHPEEAQAMLEIISQYTEVAPESLARTIAFVGPKLDVQSVINQQEWHHSMGYIDQVADPALFIDLSFGEHENIPEGFVGAQ